MAKPKKLIPCRVCGKMFEPCSYCQKHNDVFRWRNFACSLNCAKQYIASTEAYREAQREKARFAENKKNDVVVEEVIEETEAFDNEEIIEETEEVEEVISTNDEEVDSDEIATEFEEDTDGMVDDEIATDTEIQEE